MNQNSNCIGFEPVSRRDACVLILGTLPGAESLSQRQYYAKPQNVFWSIMGHLIEAGPELSYAQRLVHLKASGIALWDVCAAAQRVGSLDSNISEPVFNDFLNFFEAHPEIRLICFNGKNAARLYRTHVEPTLPEKIRQVRKWELPSTSPAHARMGFEEKLERWRLALAPDLHKILDARKARV